MKRSLLVLAMLLGAMFWSGSAAHASPAHVASVGENFTNNAGYGEWWWNPTSRLWETSHSNSTAVTELTGSGDCNANNSSYCEWQLPNGQCVSAESDAWTAATCTNSSREEIDDIQFSGINVYFGDVWLNANFSCSGSYIPIPEMGGVGSGQNMDVTCSPASAESTADLFH